MGDLKAVNQDAPREWKWKGNWEKTMASHYSVHGTQDVILNIPWTLQLHKEFSAALSQKYQFRCVKWVQTTVRLVPYKQLTT